MATKDSDKRENGPTSDAASNEKRQNAAKNGDSTESGTNTTNDMKAPEKGSQRLRDGTGKTPMSNDDDRGTEQRIKKPTPRRKTLHKTDDGAANGIEKTRKKSTAGIDSTVRPNQSSTDIDKARAMSSAVDERRSRLKRDRSFSFRKSVSSSYGDASKKIKSVASGTSNVLVKSALILWEIIKLVFKTIGYFLRGIWRFLVVIAIMFASVGVIGLLCAFYLFTTTVGEIPSLQDYTQIAMPQDSTIYDVDGEVIGVISTAKRDPVAFNEIDQKAKDAVVSIEDERFYDHEGVDLIGIARAVKVNYDSWRSGGSATSQGGSTITQQYVRNAYENVGTEQTIARKMTEIVLSVELEASMSKDEILNSYLNTIPYGNGCFGIEAASQYYLGHPCSELTYYEAAILASIPNAPSIYNPATEEGRKNTAERANIVLDKMYSLGKLGDMTQDELRELKQTDIDDVIHITEEERQINQPFYYDYVMRELQDDYALDEITSGGWQIYTTLSIEDAEKATEIVSDIEGRYSTSDGLVTSAIVDINVDNGSINAFCGGTDYGQSQYNIAVDGRLQNGSTMKPFLYAEMIEEFGYYTTDKVNADPIDVAGKGEKAHIIDSYLGGGNQTIERGIIHSDNAMAVRCAGDIGMDNVEKMLKACGATNDLDDNVIAIIGGQQQGYTPLEMANAYATIANQGQMNKAWCIRNITDNYGNVIYEHEQDERYAMSQETALQITQAMVKAVDQRPEWYNIPFDRNGGWTIAAKSGTTDDRTDLWCCGFDKQHAVSVWIGGRDAKIEVPTTTPTACKTLSDYFYAAHDDDKKEDFEKPKFKTPVPDIKDGESVDDYISRIKRLNLSAKVQYVSDSDADSGTVIGIENAGKLVDRGDEAIIDIAQDMVVVPNFVSMSPADVYSNADGLSITWTVEYSTSGNSEPTVTRQSIDAGAVVNEGTGVNLTVTVASPSVDSDSVQVPFVGSDNAMALLTGERDKLLKENDEQKEQIETLQEELESLRNAQQEEPGDANENTASPSDSDSDEEVRVQIPNVTGMTVEEARQVLVSIGFIVNADTTDYQRIVTGSTPSVGTSTGRGSVIVLTTEPAQEE